MNSKMTTNSQLPTNEPKKIKERKTTKTKQTRTGPESEKWTSHGGCSGGRGKGRNWDNSNSIINKNNFKKYEGTGKISKL